MDIRAFEISLSRDLLTWALPSIVIGGVLFAIGIGGNYPILRGIAIHGIAWGLVDAAIAGYGLYRVQRDSLRYPDEYRDEDRRRKLRRVLRFNALLDIFYTLAGIALIVGFLRSRFILGNGIGIVVQALFLLFFDLSKARRLPKESPSWYDPAL